MVHHSPNFSMATWGYEGTPKIHGSSFSQFLNGNLPHPFLGGPNPSYPMKWLVVPRLLDAEKQIFEIL
jgi:hypothetical protein